MHTIFKTEAIVLRICTLLQEQGLKGSLANLARTSKFFTELALDALWYELHGLEPLVMCMPKDSWKITPVKNDGIRTLNIARDLQQSDLAVLYRYAQRVRVYSYGDYFDEGVHCHESDGTDEEEETVVLPGEDLHDTLASNLGDSVTFPNLETLYWAPQYGVAGRQKPLPEFVTSENLQAFTLVLDVPRSVLLKKLQVAKHILHNCKENLRHLELQFIDPKYRYISPISIATDVTEVVMLCQNLTTLNVRAAMTSDIISHLAAMRNLHSIKIGEIVNRRNKMIQDDFQTAIEDPFPSLTTLHIHADLEGILPMLSSIKPFSIQEFVLVALSWNDTIDSNTWNSLVSGITRIGSPTELHTLSITASNYSKDLRFQTTIAPFLCFENMRSFTIELGDNIFFNAHEAEMLGTSWPWLTKLFAHGNARTPAYASLCMYGIINLALTCTKLEELYISFTDIPHRTNANATSSKSRTTHPGTSTEYNYNFRYGPYPRFLSKSQVKMLNVGYSKVNDEEYVSDILKLLFPLVMGLSWDVTCLTGKDMDVWRRIRANVYRYHMDERSAMVDVEL